MTHACSEKLLYLMPFIMDDIDTLVENVITDSEEDPHYSAVTAQNMIKCYVDVMTEMGINLPFHDVRSYFSASRYSECEYGTFEEKRKIESAYYIGKQF